MLHIYCIVILTIYKYLLAINTNLTLSKLQIPLIPPRCQH